MATNDFAKFIDELRVSRNLSREELVDGIISSRQYYRFISGESSLKYNIILELFERLGVSNSLSHEYYKKTTDGEFQRLQEIYKHLYLDDLKKANDLYQQVEPYDLILESNSKYYQFITQLLFVKQNKITYNQAAKEIIKLVDYPDVLSKEILTYLEKNMLVYLTNFLMSNKDYRIASFFYKIVQKEIEDNSTLDEYSIPFRIITSKCLGMIEENSKALTVIKDTETRFILNDNYIPMLNLYFYKALQERELYDDYRFRKSLQNLYALLNISPGNEIKIKYQNQILKSFGLKESDLIEFK